MTNAYFFKHLNQQKFKASTNVVFKCYEYIKEWDHITAIKISKAKKKIDNLENKVFYLHKTTVISKNLRQ